MFDHIVPCGIADKQVTSLLAEGCDATMSEVVDAVIAASESVWGPAGDIQRVTDPIHRVTDPIHRVTDPIHRVTDPIQQVTDPIWRATDPVGAEPVRPSPVTVESVAVSLSRRRPAERPLDRRLQRSGVDPRPGCHWMPASRPGCGSRLTWGASTWVSSMIFVIST